MPENPYFKPRTSKRLPQTREFGVLAQYENKTGIMWLNKESQVDTFVSEDVREVWNRMCEADTPCDYRCFELYNFFIDFLYDIAKPEWFTETVPTKKGRLAEKITCVGGGTKALLLAVRAVKDRPRSDSKGDINLQGLENHYEEGLNQLMRDLNYELDYTDIKTRLFATVAGALEMYQFLRENAEVPIGLTLGSVALNNIKTHFLKQVLPRLPQEEEKFVTRALYGGRGEVFQTLVKQGWMIDMQSLYGTACTYPLPIGGARYIPQMIVERILEKREVGFVAVHRMYIPETLPSGPIPVRVGNVLTFPVGEITSTEEEPLVVFTPILQRAIEKKGVEVYELGKAIVFSQCLEILEGYAYYWGKKKEEAENRSDMLGRRLSRMLLILPWGKFSQREERVISHFGTLPDQYKKYQDIYVPDDDLPYWEETVVKKSPYHLVHISAAITNYAMLISMETQDKLEEEYGQRVAYTDTDSYILDRGGSVGKIPAEVFGSGLGKFKIQYQDKGFLCLSTKNYLIFNPVTMKVIDAKGKGIPGYDPQNIQDILDGKPYLVEYETPVGIVEVLTDIFKYKGQEAKFKYVLASRRKSASRSYPSLDRDIVDIRELDQKRLHTSLYESRPKTKEELCQAFLR